MDISTNQKPTIWLLDLFIRVPFQFHGDHTVLQPFPRIELIVRIAFECEVTCTTTRHRNNVQRLRGEEHDTSLKIETARQAATSSNSHALTIAPCPSLNKMFKMLFRLLLFTLVVDQLIRPIGLLIKSSVFFICL